MKKAICIVLSLTVLAVLFTGCGETKDLDGGSTLTTTYDISLPDVLTAPMLDDDIVSRAKAELGITGNDLTPEEEALLQAKLAEMGYDVEFNNGNLQVKPPEGVTLAPETTITTAAPMPTGQKDSSNAEAVKLYKDIRKILSGKKFSLRIQTAIEGGAVTMSTSLTIDNDKMAYDIHNMWSTSYAAASLAGSEDPFGQAKIRIAAVELALGKTMRLLVLPEGKTYIVFPDKKFYVDGGGAESEDLVGDYGTEDLVEQIAGSSVPDEDISASKVTLDGKEYICASYENADGSTMSYYFLNGEWKRLERTADGVSDVIVVEKFTDKFDDGILSIKGMLPVDMAKVMSLMGG